MSLGIKCFKQSHRRNISELKDTSNKYELYELRLIKLINYKSHNYLIQYLIKSHHFYAIIWGLFNTVSTTMCGENAVFYITFNKLYSYLRFSQTSWEPLT